MTKKQKFDFEKALTELEDIVENLEKDELSLEKALANFEKGIKLTRECHKALNQAQQTVKILTESGAMEDFQQDLSDQSNDE